MNATPASTQLHRMFEVQHFVVDDVFQDIRRDAGVVENAADDNGIVGGIIVSENSARFGLAPAHARSRHQPMKKTCIQFFKNLV